MKLKQTISSWTILIPSLVLNVALLGAAAYFLNQLQTFYVSSAAPTPLQLAHRQSPGESAKLAAIVATVPSEFKPNGAADRE